MLNPYQKSKLKLSIHQDEKAPVANIIRIFENYTGERAAARGKYTLVKCAFHDDSRPSMALYPETGSYYCFACGATGDGYTFVMKKDGVSFKEALEVVKDKYL